MTTADPSDCTVDATTGANTYDQPGSAPITTRAASTPSSKIQGVLCFRNSSMALLPFESLPRSLATEIGMWITFDKRNIVADDIGIIDIKWALVGH